MPRPRPIEVPDHADISPLARDFVLFLSDLWEQCEVARPSFPPPMAALLSACQEALARLAAAAIAIDRAQR